MGAGDGDSPLPPSPRLKPEALSPFDRFREPIIVLCLLVFGAILHGRSLSIGYMADDYDLIYALNRPDYSLLEPLPFGRGTYFRPTVMFSLMLELKAGGGPVMHHAVNLLFHLANGALLFLILRRLRADLPAAASLTFLFLCHRSSVPNVYWISPRAEMLACMGYLTAILGFLRYSNGRSPLAPVALFLSGAFLALLSKESAVTIPVVLEILWWLTKSKNPEADSVPGRSVGPLVGWSAALCLLYVAYLAGRFYVRSGGVPMVSFGELARGAARGAVLLLTPISESRLQLLTQTISPSLTVIAFGVLLVLVVVFGLRNPRGLVLTVGLPLVAFLPLLVIQGGGPARVLYLPVALVCIGIAASQGARTLRVAACAGILGAIMAAASFGAGSEWVRNWDLAGSCCRDFKRISDRSAEAPVILLTSPRSIGDAPVLSNDARAFLYFCLNRSPGYHQNLETVAEVVLADSAGSFPVVRQSRADSSAIAYRVQPEDGWFVIPSSGKRQLDVGETITTVVGKLRVLQPFYGAGVVSGFEIELGESNTSSDQIIVEFTGTGFRALPSD